MLLIGASGCARSERPDIICEHAGDTARWYWAGDPPREPWRADRTIHYFLDEGRYRVIERHRVVEWGAMTEDDWRIANSMSGRLPENEPGER